MLPPTIETVADYDVVDEEAEEFEDAEDGETEATPLPIDPVALKAEIEELEGYRKLAMSIGENEKGNALIKTLPGVLDEIVKKGGQRKAVIFTESVRTQTDRRSSSQITDTRTTSFFSTGRTTTHGARPSFRNGWLAIRVRMPFPAPRQRT